MLILLFSIFINFSAYAPNSPDPRHPTSFRYGGTSSLAQEPRGVLSRHQSVIPMVSVESAQSASNSTNLAKKSSEMKDSGMILSYYACDNDETASLLQSITAIAAKQFGGTQRAQAFESTISGSLSTGRPTPLEFQFQVIRKALSNSFENFAFEPSGTQNLLQDTRAMYISFIAMRLLEEDLVRKKDHGGILINEPMSEESKELNLEENLSVKAYRKVLQTVIQTGHHTLAYHMIHYVMHEFSAVKNTTPAHLEGMKKCLSIPTRDSIGRRFESIEKDLKKAIKEITTSTDQHILDLFSLIRTSADKSSDKFSPAQEELLNSFQQLAATLEAHKTSAEKSIHRYVEEVSERVNPKATLYTAGLTALIIFSIVGGAAGAILGSKQLAEKIVDSNLVQTAEASAARVIVQDLAVNLEQLGDRVITEVKTGA